MDKAYVVSACSKLNPTRTLAKFKQGFRDGLQLIGYSLILSHVTFIPYAQAAPTGGQVVGGSGSISQVDVNTTINQTSSRLAIDWQSFDVNRDERVQFIQPGVSSIALNRILSNQGSQIHGRIDANGQVILVNPHGVFFSPTASINVGGIIASGLDIKTNDFMNGDFIFNEVAGSDGVIVNSGIINASLGGSVTLLGKKVKNEGVISARLGAVNLAAGRQAIVTFDHAGLIGIKVSKQVLQEELGVDPAILNSGEINAAGGKVLLTASVSQDIFSNAVNRGNIEQATSVVANGDGTFSLGAGADVVNSGTINVSTEKGDAGQVVLLGENVTQSGDILAEASNGRGGDIELHAKDTTLILGDSVTSARAIDAGQGGTVKVLGEKVALIHQSKIDVSGKNGGGQAFIGGDYQGENPNLRNAKRVYVDQGAKIYADAIDDGDGGKVINWADESMWFYGNVSATGGQDSGNGGFVEISGKQYLDFNGNVDTSAIKGVMGQLLLDPTDIVILDGSGDSAADGSNTFAGDVNGVTGQLLNNATPDSSPSSIYESELEGLASNTNIVLEATNNITINDLTDNELSLSLDNSGSITFTADSDGVDGGGFTMSTDDTIRTQGGSVTVNATGDVDLGEINTTGANDIAGGNITINSSGSVQSTGLIAKGGDTGTSSDSATDKPGKAGGAVTIDAASVEITGTIDASGSNGTYDTNGGGNNGQNGGNGGLVEITASTGDIIVGAINSSGGEAAGDYVDTIDTGDGGDAGTIDLNVSASGLITLNGDLSAKGAIGYLENEGAVSQVGSHGDGAAITINGASKLGSSITIDASGANDATLVAPGASGDIAFKKTLEGTTSRTENLTLVGDNIDFGTAVDSGTIGLANRLGVIDISALGDVNAYGDLLAQKLIVQSSNSFDSHGYQINTVGGSPNRNTHDQSSVSIISTTSINIGDVNTYGGTVGGESDGLAGGDISLTAASINVGALDSHGSNASGLGNHKGGDAGAISVDAIEEAGLHSITLNGDIDSSGGSATGSGTVGVDEIAQITLDNANTPGGQVTLNYNATEFTSEILITGSSGFDTLTAANRQNYWQINTTDSTIGPNSSTIKITFNNFEELVGNAKQDDFVVNDSSNIDSIDGGANTLGVLDSLTGSADTNTWNITDGGLVNNTGTLSDSNGLHNFSRIHKLIGNTGQDIFNLHDSIDFDGSIDGGGGVNDQVIAGNRANDWAITAIDNTGTVTGLVDTLSGEGTFSRVEILTGNTEQDIFTLHDSIDFAGRIDGAGGASDPRDEIIAGNRSTNNWEITDTGNTGKVTGIVPGTAGTGIFENIEVLTGNGQTDILQLHDSADFTGQFNAGGGLGDQVIGGNRPNDWLVTGTNSGTVTGLNNGANDSFTGVEILTGNADRDRFSLHDIVEFQGSIDGAGSGTDGDEILAGDRITNTWNILNDKTGSVTGLLNGFSNIENLIGNAQRDDFNFYNTSPYLGGIDGGGGTNSITVRNNVSHVWTVTGNNNTGTFTGLRDDFTQIQELVGNNGDDHLILLTGVDFTGTFDGMAGNDQITAGNTTNTWLIKSANSGSVTGLTGDFTNVEALRGSADDDHFHLMTGVTFNGSINGGANGSSGDTITAGNNALNNWLVNSPNSGSVTGLSGGFNDIENLIGNEGVDDFDIDAIVDGLIDGGTGLIPAIESDNINVVGLNSIIVRLGTVFGFADGRIHIDNFESITAAATSSNSLVGENADTDWIIDGTNSGQSGSMRFSNFNRIFGGPSNDVFTMTSSGGVTRVNGIDGVIDADAGGIDISPGDILDISQKAGEEIDLADGTDFDVKDINIIRGNNTDNILTGSNSTNTWIIDSENSGQVSFGGNIVAFEGFSIINGGTDDDTFNITVANTINTSHSLDLTAYTGANDPSKNDDIVINGGDITNFIGSYTPGSNNTQASIEYVDSSNSNAYTLNYNQFEDANDVVSDSVRAAEYTVYGTGLADTITIDDASFQVQNPLNTFTRVNYLNKRSLALVGETGVDGIDIVSDLTFTGTLSLSAETISQTSGTRITADSLILNSVINPLGTDANRFSTNVNNLQVNNMQADLYIIENNGINIDGLTNTGVIDLRVSGGDVTNSGNIISSNAVKVLASNGSIQLNADNQLSGPISLLAANGNTELVNKVATDLAVVTTGNLEIDSTGDLTDSGDLRATGVTDLRSNANILLDQANDFGGAVTVRSANDVELNDINGLSIASINASGSVTTRSTGLSLGSVTAANIDINAGSGAITDNNGGAKNLTGNLVKLRSSTGIGSDVEAIETTANNLDVINSNNGFVNIENSGEVRLTNLVNNGDIDFRNDKDIIINNVDANYNSGQLTMVASEGSIFGVNRPPAGTDLTIPDITARTAVITTASNFGSLGRPMVVRVRDQFVLASFFSNIFYFGGIEPKEIQNSADIQASVFDAISSVSGQQLIDVESLSDIDPAIFSEVNNYNMGDIAIRMPRDQLYEDELADSM